MLPGLHSLDARQQRLLASSLQHSHKRLQQLQQRLLTQRLLLLSWQPLQLLQPHVSQVVGQPQGLAAAAWNELLLQWQLQGEAGDGCGIPAG